MAVSGGGAAQQSIAGIGAIVLSIIGLAALTVILSKSSQTAQVFSSFGNAIANMIRAATSSGSASPSSPGLSSPGDLLSGVTGGLGGIGDIGGLTNIIQ